ncbi:MAG: universal stress protein [Phycisphaerales bacterium]|nr:universal stress protein [Phycisphaerales bacterium]
MLKRIIVAFDGTELAREALAYGVEIARAAGVPVTLLRAIEPPSAPPVMPDPALAMGDVLVDASGAAAELAAQRERAEREMPESQAFVAKAGVACDVVLGEGMLHEVLRTLADPTDLICAGFAGRFASTRIGSRAQALVREGPCPVLLASGPMRDLSRVLVSFDGSGEAEHAVRWGAALAEQVRWPVSVVVSPGSRGLDANLVRAQELAPQAGVIHFGAAGSGESEQIAEASRHTGAALVVMGAHHDHWLHRLMFGDSTLRRARELNAPVILVR